VRALLAVGGLVVAASSPALTVALFTGLTLTLAAQAAFIIRSIRRGGTR
jgi:hypothetical protein